MATAVGRSISHGKAYTKYSQKKDENGQQSLWGQRIWSGTLTLSSSRHSLMICG